MKIAAPNPAGLIYLASPYAHKDEPVRNARYNYAVLATAVLTAHGYRTFSPIAHSHNVAAKISLHFPYLRQEIKDFEFWRRLDIGMIDIASSMVILGIDGWRESKGIRAEVNHCDNIGRDIWFISVGKEPEVFGAWELSAFDPNTYKIVEA